MLETTRSAESAPSSASRASSASEQEEKSSHGFWSSLVDKVSDVFSAAKDWVCDAFGIGVNQVFDLYPSGRSSVPQSNTKGYVFYDWENDGIYDYMEFYSAGSGAATYVSLPELGGIQ